MILRDPTLARALLDRVAAVVTDLLTLQLDAGADAVQLFDSWAGELSVQDFNSLCLPVLRRIVEDLDGAPVIYYVNGIGNLLESAAATGATVLGIDWRVDLKTVRDRVGEATVVQGNLDPLVLFGSHDEIRSRALEILRAGDEAPRHVFNLGHGILPPTPIEAVEVLVETVKNYRPGEVS